MEHAYGFLAFVVHLLWRLRLYFLHHPLEHSVGVVEAVVLAQVHGTVIPATIQQHIP